MRAEPDAAVAHRERRALGARRVESRGERVLVEQLADERVKVGRDASRVAGVAVLQEVVEAVDGAAAERGELELRVASERVVHKAADAADLRRDLLVLLGELGVQACSPQARRKACSPIGTPHLMCPATGVNALGGAYSPRGCPRVARVAEKQQCS